ncbi:MAG: hypothetical protein IJY27_04680 [Clostridia bacterium]|nr:hypothetical protein [Clostridia bacterium]
MTSFVLITFIIILFTLQSLLCKKYSDAYPGNPAMASPVFTVVSGLTVVLVSLTLMRFSFDASALTVVLGIINALALVGYNTSLIKASQSGPYSVLMVFSLAGAIVIPAIIATVVFHDGLSWLKALGILIVIASVYMVSYRRGERTSSSKWFIPCCLVLGLCNGAYGTLLDIQQRLTGAEQKEEMVAITYAVAALLSILILTVQNKSNTMRVFKQSKRSLIYLITCSLVVASAIHVMVYILPLVNVTMLYTMDNAGVLLLSVLCSCIMFREKLSALNIIGCLTMCGALVMVAMF